MLKKMSLFATHRRWSASRLARGVALWLVLCVIGSAWPRFELHTHVVHAHGHAHALSQSTHEVPPATDGGAPGTLSTHVHDATTLTVGLSAVSRLDLPALRLATWQPAFHAEPADTDIGPPPHRPPIA